VGDAEAIARRFMLLERLLEVSACVVVTAFEDQQPAEAEVHARETVAVVERIKVLACFFEVAHGAAEVSFDSIELTDLMKGFGDQLGGVEFFSERQRFVREGACGVMLLTMALKAREAEEGAHGPWPSACVEHGIVTQCALEAVGCVVPVSFGRVQIGLEPVTLSGDGLGLGRASVFDV